MKSVINLQYGNEYNYGFDENSLEFLNKMYIWIGFQSVL